MGDMDIREERSRMTWMLKITCGAVNRLQGLPLPEPLL